MAQALSSTQSSPDFEKLHRGIDFASKSAGHSTGSTQLSEHLIPPSGHCGSLSASWRPICGSSAAGGRCWTTSAAVASSRIAPGAAHGNSRHAIQHERPRHDEGGRRGGATSALAKEGIARRAYWFGKYFWCRSIDAVGVGGTRIRVPRVVGYMDLVSAHRRNRRPKFAAQAQRARLRDPPQLSGK